MFRSRRCMGGGATGYCRRTPCPADAVLFKADAALVEPSSVAPEELLPSLSLACARSIAMSLARARPPARETPPAHACTPLLAPSRAQLDHTLRERCFSRSFSLAPSLLGVAHGAFSCSFVGESFCFVNVHHDGEDLKHSVLELWINISVHALRGQ